MQVKTIRLNVQGQGVLGCDQCGKTKVMQLAEVQHLGHRLKIKCSCGHTFAVSIEARKFYRKPTQLPGVEGVSKVLMCYDRPCDGRK